MNWREVALAFECAGERLLGIVSRPDTPHDVGIVIVVGGPQYRGGSHRQFVSLARHLAGAGFAVFRFDCRGMGDSGGDQRGFEDIGADIGCAIDTLIRAVPRVTRVVLWGLCDGASAALLYLHRQPDVRVAGLCLLNPWVRSEATLAKTRVKRYYRQRLMQRTFWAKLISGQVALSAAAGLWRNLRAMLVPVANSDGPDPLPFQQRMAQAWGVFTGPVLLLMSERDFTANEFDEFLAGDVHWRYALSRRPPERVDLPGADHTCSTPGAQRGAEIATSAWARREWVDAA